MHEFIAIDEGDLIESGIEAYESETDETLYAGDERRFMIHCFAYMLMMAAREVNYGINQGFVSTACEDGLGVLATDYQVERLQGEKALVTMHFTLQSGHNGIVIPEGTRVTYDGTHFFATTQAMTIPAGTETVDTACVATLSGSEGYNDIPVGSVSTLVDHVAGVVAVSNTDISAGGSELEDLESWRERITLKKRGLNTAGSEQAYVYHIKSADSSIGDVKVLNKGDATVQAVILCKNGVLPNEALLARVQEKVSAENTRPLTDVFEVTAPEVVSYEIDFQYTVSPSDMDRVSQIKQQVSEAVETFRKEVEEHLGTDVIPDSLRRYVLNAGASTVALVSPTDIVVPENAVAKMSGTAVFSYDGMR